MSTAYPELGPITASLGLPHAGEPDLQFTRGKRRLAVSLEINSGGKVPA